MAYLPRLISLTYMKNYNYLIDIIGESFTRFVDANHDDLVKLHLELGPDLPFPIFCYIQFSIEYERSLDY